jgi:DNA-binding response OmpR family regulator
MAFVVAALGDTEIRQLVKTLLESDGHSSAIFGAGGPAVTEALAGAPDLVIIDTQLADTSAMQLCDAMRTHPSTAAIPIVVVGAPDRHVTRLLANTGGRVHHAPLPSCLRETIAVALTTAADDPAPPFRRHGTAQPVRQHVSPRRTIRGSMPPGADVAPPTRPEGPSMRVLLVEDDASIAEPLIDGLARYGFQVDWVATGAAALSAPHAEMVLLDLGLPDMDGLEVCRRLPRTGDASVIMLTARGDECDRVVGLELGADDYLAKPFSLRELVARMRAVGRRTRPASAIVAQP